MIATRPASNQREYDEFWSGDPAIVQLPADATDEQRKEHAEKLKRARETSDWTGVVVPGSTPTKFVLRQIKGSQFRWIVDQCQRTDMYRIGPAEMAQLIFRCAFVKVVSLGVPISDKQVRHQELGLIAHEDVTNTLDEIHVGIVTELADLAFDKANRLNPL